MLLTAMDSAMTHSFRFMNGDELLNDLDHFIENGGPSPNNYQSFHALLDALAVCLHYNLVSQKKWNRMLSKCDFLHDVESVMGHCRVKPYGYAGDFGFYEKIDTMHRSVKHGKWDAFTHTLPMAAAMRQRRKYFKSMLESRLPSNGNLLNISGGAGRSLYEYFEDNPQSDLVVTSVEMEEKAVSCARHLNRTWANQICFVPMNVFRFETTETFDIIWAAHLFDYLGDAPFVALLKKCRNWLKPDGVLVVCGFSDIDHVDRTYWELFGDWHCFYRTEETLTDLAVEAGFTRKKMKVQKADVGLNQYLILKN